LTLAEFVHLGFELGELGRERLASAAKPRECPLKALAFGRSGADE
jgi:hypothetical protein